MLVVNQEDLMGKTMELSINGNLFLCGLMDVRAATAEAQYRGYCAKISDRFVEGSGQEKSGFLGDYRIISPRNYQLIKPFGFIFFGISRNARLNAPVLRIN